jgi:DtxR family Mn-dependent transcriptional regulator
MPEVYDGDSGIVRHKNEIRWASAMDSLSVKMQDYLETIFFLEKENSVVRVKQISESMDVKNSSVHSALHQLAKKGLVEHEHYGYVNLTDNGRSMARRLEKKHWLLARFLHKYLGVKKKQAEEEACRIEHVISDNTLHNLEKFLFFLSGNQGVMEKWLSLAAKPHAD